MSIDSEDLDAAVAAGVMPQAQADALRVFVAERHRTTAAPAQRDAEDERFRFMTGFNDFFFAIGILLLGFGLLFYAMEFPALNPISILIVWGLSELLVRRMRLVLPGILLAVLFIIFVYRTVPTDLSWFASQQMHATPGTDSGLRWVGLSGTNVAIATKALLGTAAASIYYWRFRLPFALLPIAGSLVIAAISLIWMVAGSLSPLAHALLMLTCGFVVFIVAMSFDLSDRNRVTRRSDCAFWLHLLAAPLIVHSLVSMVTPSLRQMTNEVAGIIVAIVTVLAVIAILIERRALLVSALIYIGAVIAYAIGGAELWGRSASRGAGGIYMLTVLILGAFVITLGVGWMPLRKLLLRISPTLASRLPPVPDRA